MHLRVQLTKILQSLNKTSRSSQAYLHLTQQVYVNQLAAKIASTTFDDAAGTARDTSLTGPVSLETAPYGRIPNNKGRKDQRQGTIDQDPEFISFLEDLTNPNSKPVEVDQENISRGKEKVTSTPLIEFLREKKANKGKEAVTAKSGKGARLEARESKSSPLAEKKASRNSNKAAAETRTPQAVKVETAAREAARIAKKEVAPPTPREQADRTSAQTLSPPKARTVNPLAEKKRERGVASAAAKILQRDLGIGATRGARGGRRGGHAQAAKETIQGTQDTENKVTDVPSTRSQEIPPAAIGPTTSTSSVVAQVSDPQESTHPPETTAVTAKVPPTGPSRGRVHNIPTPNKPIPSAPAASKAVQKASTLLSDPNSKQAFLKHANPSQGVTEPLLQQAFAAYGTVEKVEIDKKKGFAYIDFSNPEGLLKAMQASPVKVAQGQVVVLERKTGPNLQMRNARGGVPKPPPRGSGPASSMRGGRGGTMGRGGRSRAPLPVSNTSSVTSQAVATDANATSSVTVEPTSGTGVPAHPEDSKPNSTTAEVSR